VLRRSAPLLVAALAVVGLAAVGWSAATARSTSAEIAVHFSHFGPDALTVRAGEAVTFVLRNQDPIDHEWIVGDEATHERHRTGTEPVHDQRPTEITLPALETRSTTVTFTTPGRYRYICHLPGHEAYGMVGVVTVVP
jgi:uncharacterized cupredoxin-like copper-binding protein